MTAHAQMGTETSWNERMIDIATWVATIDGVVLWICSIFAKDIAHSYLLAPVYLAIGILLTDWVLMWGTNAQRLRRVVDRRMIMAFLGLAFVFRVWANDVLLNETTIERDYPIFLILSGISLAAAAGSLLLLAIKGQGWHLAGSLGTQQTLGDSMDDTSSDILSSLHAYPTRFAGPPNSLWRICLAYAAAAAALYLLSLMSEIFLFIVLVVISCNLLSVFQRVFFAGGVGDASR